MKTAKIGWIAGICLWPLILPFRGAENFDREPINGWEFNGGAMAVSEASGRVLGCTGEGRGFWTIAPIRDFSLDFRFQPGGGWGEVSFCRGGEPPQNREYSLRMSTRDIFLTRRAEGAEKSLGRRTFTFTAKQWVAMTIVVCEGKITLSIEGKPVLASTDSKPLPAGTMAFGCRQGESISFDDIFLYPIGIPTGK